VKKTELKKLSLNRESLRRLDEAEVSQVAGARTTVTEFSYCYTCPC
jgi:hypothetical protein